MSAAALKVWAVEHAKPHLHQVLLDLPGVSGAVLASSDGFEVASSTSTELPLSQLAAMAGAMHGLGEAMTRETGLERARDIIVDSDLGKIVLMSIPSSLPHLVLLVIASGQSPLGQLLLQCRKCAVAIGKEMEGRSALPAAVNP